MYTKQCNEILREDFFTSISTHFYPEIILYVKTEKTTNSNSIYSYHIYPVAKHFEARRSTTAFCSQIKIHLFRLKTINLSTVLHIFLLWDVDKYPMGLSAFRGVSSRETSSCGKHWGHRIFPSLLLYVVKYITLTVLKKSNSIHWTNCFKKKCVKKRWNGRLIAFYIANKRFYDVRIHMLENTFKIKTNLLH